MQRLHHGGSQRSEAATHGLALHRRRHPTAARGAAARVGAGSRCVAAGGAGGTCARGESRGGEVMEQGFMGPP